MRHTFEVTVDTGAGDYVDADEVEHALVDAFKNIDPIVNVLNTTPRQQYLESERQVRLDEAEDSSYADALEHGGGGGDPDEGWA